MDKKKMSLLVACITAFQTTFMSSALNLSVPDLSAHFGVSAGYVGWVITIYTLIVAALCVPIGKLADIMGHARMLKIGLTVFSLSSLACIFAPSMASLIVIRAIHGAGAAMIYATSNAILLDAHPKNEHGKALGISTAATYIGLSAGPVIGGIINHNFGWRYIFVVAGVLGLSATALAAKGVHDDVKDFTIEKQDFDRLGTFVFVPMVLALLYGISLVGSSGLAYVLISLALVLAVAFVSVEKKSLDPVMNIELFAKDRQFTCSNLAALMNYGATFAISYLVSIFLQVSIGLSSQTAGLILVIQPLFQAIFSPKMGSLSDRIAPYKLASAGMLMCVITLLLYAITLPKHSVIWVVVALVLGGTGFALFSSPNTNAIMSRVPAEERGQGMAVVSTMRTVGQSLSMCIVTVLVNIKLGDQTLQTASDAALIGTMKTVFIVFAIICIIGTVISSLRSLD